MKLFNKKNLFSTIAVMLTLSFIASMFAVPNANAQVTNVTYPFVDAIPRNAGVGQPVLINFGLINYLTRDGDGWNMTLIVTDPNGKTEKFDRMTWSTGTVGMRYAPTMEGNYTLRAVFAETMYEGVKYLASESGNMTLTVTGQWKANHPGHTLPDEYWTRPVDSQLREWYTIMGSWVGQVRVGSDLYERAQFNQGPESAHILWSMPFGDTLEGLAGGNTYEIGYQHGDAYEGRFGGSVIIAGVLYYNRGGSYNQATAANANSGAMGVVPGSVPYQRNTIVAVDLHTGKTLWEKAYDFNTGNAARISHGQVLTWWCLNNRGAFAYLWVGSAGTMYAIEPKTGELVYNMTNVPAGSIYFGPSGEMLKYRAVNYGTPANPNWYIQQWNSSHVVHAGKIGMMESWGSQVQGVVYNADVRGWDLNASVSSLSFVPGQAGVAAQNAVGSLAGASQTATPIVAFPGDRVLFSNHTQAGIELTGISLNEEGSVSVMYNRRTWVAPKEWESIGASAPGEVATFRQSGWASFSQVDNVGIFWTKENRVNYAFNLETGRPMWQSESQNYADSWTDAPLQEKVIAYGKLYEASVGGIVYCYDVKTGELLWEYEALDKYNESYHREAWWLIITFVTDGKVYLGHMAHSSQEPKPRGAPFFALDCETGDLVWEIDGAFRQTRWGGRAIIGDSIIATMDTYDQQIYAIGKGPSEMTVSMSNAIATAGAPVLISGTVMDISPGTQSDDAKFRFSKGVPAVSEESMSEWMLYVYKHFARPMDATGVEVTIFAQQGDNLIDIGTTTSDANGRYSITWIPPVGTTGDYEIYAYFNGSPSYYGSYAKMEAAVFAAPDVPEVKSPPYGWYILGAAIAIIAVNLVVTLLLRKK